MSEQLLGTFIIKNICLGPTTPPAYSLYAYEKWWLLWLTPKEIKFQAFVLIAH